MTVDTEILSYSILKLILILTLMLFFIISNCSDNGIIHSVAEADSIQEGGASSSQMHCQSKSNGEVQSLSNLTLNHTFEPALQ